MGHFLLCLKELKIPQADANENRDLSKKSFTWPKGHTLQSEDSDAAIFKRLLRKKEKKKKERRYRR